MTDSDDDIQWIKTVVATNKKGVEQNRVLLHQNRVLLQQILEDLRELPSSNQKEKKRSSKSLPKSSTPVTQNKRKSDAENTSSAIASKKTKADVPPKKKKAKTSNEKKRSSKSLPKSSTPVAKKKRESDAENTRKGNGNTTKAKAKPNKGRKPKETAAQQSIVQPGDVDELIKLISTIPDALPDLERPFSKHMDVMEQIDRMAFIVSHQPEHMSQVVKMVIRANKLLPRLKILVLKVLVAREDPKKLKTLKRSGSTAASLSRQMRRIENKSDHTMAIMKLMAAVNNARRDTTASTKKDTQKAPKKKAPTKQTPKKIAKKALATGRPLDTNYADYTIPVCIAEIYDVDESGQAVPDKLIQILVLRKEGEVPALDSTTVPVRIMYTDDSGSEPCTLDMSSMTLSSRAPENYTEKVYAVEEIQPFTVKRSFWRRMWTPKIGNKYCVGSYITNQTYTHL